MTDFRALHVPGAPLVMPNPWDVGSARMLEALGAKALASTSAGAAFAQGRHDGDLVIDDLLAAATEISNAVSVPVSADLENCGSDSPDAVGNAIRAAGAARLAGASIEDLGKEGDDPIYPFDLAVQRVEAAIEAARETGIVLTARSEGLLTGTLTLAQVCERITAFAKAGADVVFAPGLKTSEDVQAVVNAAGSTPVSVLVAAPTIDLTVDNLARLGAARISVGSGFARAAYGTVISMMRTALSEGRFDYPDTTATGAEIESLLPK